MKKKLFTLILLVLMVIGGKMLPISERPGLSENSSENKLALVSPQRVPLCGIECYPVVRVVDGDTIVVEINGVQEKIRLIGVDTPEAVDPRKPVECFGKEASAFTRSLLTGVSVRLEPDTTQGDRDRYGRLLRYVFLSDGTLVNKEIIAEGYGHEYTYRIPYSYQADFEAAEQTARETEKGLWAPYACK